MTKQTSNKFSPEVRARAAACSSARARARVDEGGSATAHGGLISTASVGTTAWRPAARSVELGGARNGPRAASPAG